MNFQNYLQKQLNYAPTLSAPELSDQITEKAFNTSALLMNMGQVKADNPSYRNVYVTHPSISRVAEGANIPASTVQTYLTTDADFTKIASKIEFTNEVLEQSKFDIEANTSLLVGNVAANEIAKLCVENFETRLSDTPTTDEEILQVKSGIAGSWGTDTNSVYDVLARAVKQIPDVYDIDSKLFCNKRNFVDFASAITASGEQVWLIQNGMLLGRYPIVITDQLDNDTMYFGSMSNAFDVVALQGNQTVDNITAPDLLKITNTSKYATVAKDLAAVVALKASV